MTFKFNGWPHKTIGYLFCALFQSHQSIQTGVTVWKRSIRVKSVNFWPLVNLKFDGWPRKTMGHLFYATLSFVYHFIAIGEFKLELQSGNAQIGAKFVLTSVTLTFDLWTWPFAWSSLLSMVITPENFMMIRWHCQKCVTDGRMDRQTTIRRDRSVLRDAWSQLKINRLRGSHHKRKRQGLNDMLSHLVLV